MLIKRNIDIFFARRKEDIYLKFLATKEFIDKKGYIHLDNKTEYKGFLIGVFKIYVRKKYSSLNKEQKKIFEHLVFDLLMLPKEYLYNIKVCKKCGKKFITKVNNQLYCSQKCVLEVKKERKRGYDKLEKAKCKYCKKTFKKKTKHQVFCSQKCREIFYPMRKYVLEKTTTKTCFCGKDFTTTDSTRKYCSQKCAKKVIKIKLSQSNKKIPEKLNYEAKENSIQSNNYYKRYTNQEDLFLLENWGKIPKKEISLKLSRSYFSITSRYMKLKQLDKKDELMKSKSKNKKYSLVQLI